MIPLTRYLVSDMLRTQRWVAPLLVYLAALMIVNPPNGPVLPTYAMAAAALLPVTMWFTVIVCHSEEPAQAAITMSIIGSFAWVFLARFLTALLGAVVTGLVALAWITVATNDHVTATRLGVGALDFAMNAVAGVAFGMLISRPVMPKIAWTLVLGVGVCLAQLLVRQAPPVNAMIDLYSDERGPDAFGPLSVIALESLVLSAVAIGVAHAVARRRV